MTPNTREATHNYYKTVDTREPADVVALFALDAVYRRPGYPSLEGTEALLVFYGADRVIAQGRHAVETVLVEGDRTAVQGRFEGVLRNGQKVSLRFADVFRWKDGLIAERDTYFDAPLV